MQKDEMLKKKLKRFHQANIFKKKQTKQKEDEDIIKGGKKKKRKIM